jgi:hypothetical protein
MAKSCYSTVGSILSSKGRLSARLEDSSVASILSMVSSFIDSALSKCNCFINFLILMLSMAERLEFRVSPFESLSSVFDWVLMDDLRVYALRSFV